MITFDETKRLANIRKHGFDFAGCEVIFENHTVTREDPSSSYGEHRFQTIGIWNGVVVFVVHTPRSDDDHIISIRKADRHEQRIWEASLPN